MLTSSPVTFYPPVEKLFWGAESNIGLDHMRLVLVQVGQDSIIHVIHSLGPICIVLANLLTSNKHLWPDPFWQMDFLTRHKFSTHPSGILGLNLHLFLTTKLPYHHCLICKNAGLTSGPYCTLYLGQPRQLLVSYKLLSWLAQVQPRPLTFSRPRPT